MTGKYQPLTKWLQEQAATEVTLTFTELEAIVGTLPDSARVHRPWWGNTPKGQASGWLDAGWVVSGVDLQARIATFVVGEPAQRGRVGRAPILDGTVALERLAVQAGWPDLVALVASHTVFLHPDTVSQTAGQAVFPVVRDPMRRGQLGQLPDGQPVVFDDNSTPTDVFLWAADRIKGPDVQFNHVWNRSLEPGCYTALWNLCCTPAFLAKTSDTHPLVIAALQYRAYDLYGALPDGVEPPDRPDGYEHVEWAESPPPLGNLERQFRTRMERAPGRRGALAARELGWLYSNGPDATIPPPR